MTVKAGLVAVESPLVLPPHRQVCLALLTGTPEQTPLVAQALGIAPSRLVLVRGATSKDKLFRVEP